MNLPSHNSFRFFAAWCALLAVMLQFAAMPLANTHMLQRGLERVNAQTVTICTPLGSTELQLGQDGQPLQTHVDAWVHCVICFVGGSAPLITGSAAVVPVIHLTALAGGKVTAALAPQGAGSLWPWSQGPPA